MYVRSAFCTARGEDIFFFFSTTTVVSMYLRKASLWLGGERGVRCVRCLSELLLRGSAGRPRIDVCSSCCEKESCDDDEELGGFVGGDAGTLLLMVRIAEDVRPCSAALFSFPTSFFKFLANSSKSAARCCPTNVASCVGGHARRTLGTNHPML